MRITIPGRLTTWIGSWHRHHDRCQPFDVGRTGTRPTFNDVYLPGANTIIASIAEPDTVSSLMGVRRMIETMPPEKAVEASQRMKFGDVKFRMVLTMKETGHAHQ